MCKYKNAKVQARIKYFLKLVYPIDCLENVKNYIKRLKNACIYMLVIREVHKTSQSMIIQSQIRFSRVSKTQNDMK